MRIATIKDKHTVVKIIQESFENNPSVDWVISTQKSKKKALTVLAEYAFNVGLRRKGVYLSSDNEATAICYRHSNKINPFFDILYKLHLLFGAIGFKNLKNVRHRQKYIKSKKPQQNDYLYFWFFGASNNGKGKGSAYDLQKHLFRMADANKLPIFLETSIRKNRVVYERYGFEVHHTWHVQSENIDMWFMKREPQ
jgi:hypothetical protein